ncbi:hypothetical protein TI05_01445 [Achromatium sp. WMS3]|nr:hypothetical protein TI05_01445 [Achromatium sp. WMS3]
MYGFSITLNTEFTKAIEDVTKALKDQGFGILSNIDVQATLKAKLGADMRPYQILGACNPPFAHQAITVEPQIGLLLPCNVVVRELETGQIQVEFMDPESVLKLVDNPKVPAVAAQVKDRLLKAKAALEQSGI